MQLKQKLFFAALLLLAITLFAQQRQSPKTQNHKTILNAAFLCVDGVYNSELMAPYDVLQHSIIRDSTNYIRCFIVSPDGKPFVTFEGGFASRRIFRLKTYHRSIF